MELHRKNTKIVWPSSVTVHYLAGFCKRLHNTSKNTCILKSPKNKNTTGLKTPQQWLFHEENRFLSY